MSVSGVCQVCEAAEADRTCGQCGRLVCEKHVDDRTGLCAECVSSGGDGTPGEPNGPDEDDVPQF